MIVGFGTYANLGAPHSKAIASNEKQRRLLNVVCYAPAYAYGSLDISGVQLFVVQLQVVDIQWM